jgi:hypothetical protein
VHHQPDSDHLAMPNAAACALSGPAAAGPDGRQIHHPDRLATQAINVISRSADGRVLPGGVDRGLAGSSPITRHLQPVKTAAPVHPAAAAYRHRPAVPIRTTTTTTTTTPAVPAVVNRSRLGDPVRGGVCRS